LNHLKWREGLQTIMATKFSWANPPKHIAELARERDLADMPGSDRAEKMAAAFGVCSGPTSADLCIDLSTLDHPGAEPAAALPRSVPRFSERIGKPIVGEISINRA
jgi:hypothetical protein